MTTVYRTRALVGHDSHAFLFLNDRGGRAAFDSLSDAEYRIIPKGRFAAALAFSAANAGYDEVRITSMPNEPASIRKIFHGRIVYEFHTSTKEIIERELEALDLECVDEIWTPSAWLRNVVIRRLDEANAQKCRTVPNLIDHNIFHPDVPAVSKILDEGCVPILWIGRFDKGKNYNDFFRTLSLLDEKYIPLLVVSFETEPDRTSKALHEARAYGLADRLQLFLNLSQHQLAELYTWVRDRGGAFVSTSLAESFGYSIGEALACGLPTAAYRVGGVPEVPTNGTPMHLVPVGDIYGMAQAITELIGRVDQELV